MAFRSAFFSTDVSHAARSLDQVVKTPLGAPSQIGRLTNLMQLTVDTSWYTRYRIRNPDRDPGFLLPQAVLSLARDHFPAIPRSDVARQH